MRSGCERIVSGILPMSELITQGRIAVVSSNLVDGLTTSCMKTDEGQKITGQGHKVTKRILAAITL